MTPDERLHALPVYYQRVYEAIYSAAYHGEPCPKNTELARIGGISTYARWGTDALVHLERAGLIRVRRGYHARIVVLASGQATAGVLPPGKAVKLCGPREPEINPNARERFACPYCGVRSDLNCEHVRRLAA
jgi:hypothetical protein